MDVWEVRISFMTHKVVFNAGMFKSRSIVSISSVSQLRPSDARNVMFEGKNRREEEEEAQ